MGRQIGLYRGKIEHGGAQTKHQQKRNELSRNTDLADIIQTETNKEEETVKKRNDHGNGGAVDAEITQNPGKNTVSAPAGAGSHGQQKNELFGKFHKDTSYSL